MMYLFDGILGQAQVSGSGGSGQVITVVDVTVEVNASTVTVEVESANVTVEVEE